MQANKMKLIRIIL